MPCESSLSIIKEFVQISNLHKVWCLSEQKFLLSPRKKQFGRIHIIDVFNEREPYLLDQDFFQNERAIVGFLPTFVLDSNVVGTINLLMNDQIEDEKYKNEIYDFIDNMIVDENARIYDINPIFYVLECILKDIDESYIINSLASIIMLQALDYKKFKQYRMLEKDINLEQIYLQQYGTFDLQEVAKKKFYSIKKDTLQIKNFKKSVDLTYLLLLKIAQISIYETSKSPIEKINLIKDFFVNKIEIFSAREIIISIYYMHNNIGGFIPTKQNDAEKVLKVIYNSALDVSLLRFSEILLNEGKRKLTTLAFPVTIEKHLISIGNQLTLSTLISLGHQFYSMFENDLSMIKNAKEFDKLIDNFEYFSEDKFLKRFEERKLLTTEQIEILITDIEWSIKQSKTCI